MSSKFSQQMQQKFKKDLENINLQQDSDSELQSSSDFYQGIQFKLNSQINHIKTSTVKNVILQELKNNNNKQLTTMQRYQQQTKQMKLLNSVTQNVIKQEKIEQIKIKIAKENMIQSKIKFKDQEVEEKEKQQQQSRVLFQEVECQFVGEDNNIKQEQNTNKASKQSSNKKSFQKKKQSTLNFEIQRKIAMANLQRQRINMQRQDELSMKRQNYDISQFFKQRFTKLTLPKFHQTNEKMVFIITKPKSTFTNLAPLPNNQRNVLPKNSPEIALKNLKNNRKTKLIPVSQRQIKIQFKKIVYNQEQQTNQRQQIQHTNKKNSLSANKQQKKSIKQQPTTKKSLEQAIKRPQALQIKQNKQQPHPQAKTLISPFNNLLQPYLLLISQPLRILKQNSLQYKVTFLKSYLNQNQKISNIDISQNNSQQKSLQQILLTNDQFQTQVNSLKLKQFKVTFQNVTSLKGIEKFQVIELAALQYNKIKSINGIQSCMKLLQLNLSNNLIVQSKSVQNLPQLRYLNLSHNKIRQFAFSGGSLQILKLSQNSIEVINDLNKNKYLRIIYLNQNKLHNLGKGFHELYFLQELYLSKNYIDTIQGTQKLLMLQKLDLSNNRLSKIQNPLIFMFLNHLDLSYNQLSQICHIFLPSLQTFYITNNKITGQKINKTLIYLPELKQFNIDDNQVKGFASIWFFIRFSQKIEIIKYDSNDYFLSVREKVRQLYEAIIYRNMRNLKILNHSPMDTGIKAYYESVYSSYLKKGSSIAKSQGDLQKLQKLISFVLKQNKMILNLQQENNKLRNQRFIQEIQFIQSKTIKRAQFLYKVISILIQHVKYGQNAKINFQKVEQKQKAKTLNNNKIKQTGSNTQSLRIEQPTTNKNHSFIYLANNIYHLHDKFQSQLLKKVHKIKSFFYIIKYKNQKRKKYFMKNKKTIESLLIYVQAKIILNQTKKAVSKFSRNFGKFSEESSAIMIQKVWRGYKCRKLFKKMIKRLKQNLDDSFQMQQVDLDQFAPNQLPQFDFSMPDDVNFQNMYIEPAYFQIAAEQQKKRKSNQVTKLQSIQQKKEQYQPLMNNFMKQEKKKQEKQKKKQQDQRLMKQWGFTNPATLEALRWKNKKKQQMKKKQAQLNMTAAQRYQRFKKLHK